MTGSKSRSGVKAVGILGRVAFVIVAALSYHLGRVHERASNARGSRRNTTQLNHSPSQASDADLATPSAFSRFPSAFSRG